MRIPTFALLPMAAVLLGTALPGAPAVPSADSLLSEAKAQAAPDHRAIFAIFHASWCGWCRELDKFLDDPGIKPIVDKYFVQVRFTVQERDTRELLNTPGGGEVMAKLGGAKTGLPFFAFLDSQGALIVNTIEPASEGKKGGNIGHPSAPHEVDWFLVMLSKAAPGMTAAERGSIEQYLRAQKK